MGTKLVKKIVKDLTNLQELRENLRGDLSFRRVKLDDLSYQS